MEECFSDECAIQVLFDDWKLREGRRRWECVQNETTMFQATSLIGLQQELATDISQHRDCVKNSVKHTAQLSPTATVNAFFLS